MRNVIVLEFNELVPALLDRFIAAGELPNFARLRNEAITAMTDAGEEPPLLEPWIQWVTVHSGVSYAEHGCFDLNDGAKFRGPRIWDKVSDAGGRVWVCGSMNAGTRDGRIDGYLLPDPWATEIAALPPGYFDSYTRLVRAYVQEHSSGKPEVSAADMLRFARFMVANGLSAKTVKAALRQLASERRSRTKWRRATILDRLQWDLFRAIYKAKRPRFATFFLNSTAHFQHFHWREMEPATFTVQPSDDDRQVFGDAILYGYRHMDELVGEALALAGPETSIVLCTALSQKPMLHFEDEGGRQIFRHNDHRALLQFAGVDEPYEYAPIMSQQFILSFEDEAAAARAEEKISALQLDDGQQLMLARREGDKIVSGCMIDAPPGPDAMFGGAGSNQQRRFWDHFYPLEGLRSGMHHPDGVLWIRTPSRTSRQIDRKVPLTEIAPTLAVLAGLPDAGGFPAAPLPEVTAALDPLRRAA